MINCASASDPTVEAACGVFSAGRSSTYDYLRFNATSSFQVPFYYLELVRAGKLDPRSVRPVRPSAEQVEIAYTSVFQQSPLVREVAELCDSCSNQQQVLEKLLTSTSFTQRLPGLLGTAFPEWRRLWHVHIPKTAGTSFLAAATAGGWGIVNLNRLAATANNLLDVASALRVGPETRGRVIISGHWHLWRRLEEIRPGDRVVTFVRDPLEAMISEFNFAVDVVNRAQNVHSADPSIMLDRGLDPSSLVNSYRQGFFVANVQCSYLTQDAQCRTALANLARFDAELLPSDATDYAIRKYFATVEKRRANVSNKHMLQAELPRELREELLLRSSQDFLLSEIAKQRFGDVA